jgi:uncharacterized membrane protein YgaE (UPF0421/DUF939 family)|nr:MAG TPA: hypothetical protein [Caudoviricetes sp.]
MWTWSFTLESVGTVVGIVSSICGAIYYFGISPMLENIKKDRENDIKFITTKYDTLIETLKELKEEIRLSRQDRIQQAQRHLQLVGRVDVLESRINDLRNELHGEKR